jgi:hypothetical protein
MVVVSVGAPTGVSSYHAILILVCGIDSSISIYRRSYSSLFVLSRVEEDRYGKRYPALIEDVIAEAAA